MIRIAIAAVAATFLAAAPTTTVHDFFAGPPWISIEHPVNPYDATTRDAFLLVHAFHHGTPMNFPVTGTAEGFVRGERKTVNLRFTPTSRAGVYALRQQWESQGEWTLVISVEQEKDDRASAVVDLSRGGTAVAAVRVPTRMQGGHRIPAAVAMQNIDAGLRARAQVANAR